MDHFRNTCRRRRGHTLMELSVATVASGFLLVGLASVMMIGQQVAYTPSNASRRTDAARVVNQIAEELRYATIVVQQSSRVLEFVVADRDNDGTAEKIRYEWSGTPGDPLYKHINAITTCVLDSVENFAISLLQSSKISTLTTTVDSAETLLASNTASPSGSSRDLTASVFSAQQVNPATFPSVPANAVSWNATKVEFYARERDAGNSLLVQLRNGAEPNDGPAGLVLGQASLSQATITDNFGWGNFGTFAGGVRELGFHRKYTIVWAGLGVGDAGRLLYNDNSPSGVLESNDGGATWTLMPNRQLFYRLYGTYTTPSTSYSVTRNYVSHARVTLQAGSQPHSRIEANVPVDNSPELLTTYWRADFNSSPTATNANGDSVADWALAGGGNFSAASLIGGVWYPGGVLETRPLNNFTANTVVEARCRNTSVGGLGAVVRINADRQGGQYGPIQVCVQKQSDGTQTLTLYGRTAEASPRTLFTRTKLPSGFVRFRLTILPANNVVNLQINDEDQGTFTYTTYAPGTTTDRYLTLYADTSIAEFDYIDVRSY